MEEFKQLLADKNVTSDLSFVQALPLIANDPRYGCLKMLEERKSAFKEYIEKRKTLDEKEKKQRIAEAEKDLDDLFRKSIFIRRGSRFSESLMKLERNERFRELHELIGRENTRNIFYGYVDELSRKHRERKRKLIDEHRKSFVKNLECMSELTSVSEWKEIVKILKDNESLDIIGEKMAKGLFEERQSFLKASSEEKRKELEINIRKGFENLLKESAENLCIYVGMDWEEFVPIVVDDSRFKEMSKCLKNDSKDMFSLFQSKCHSRVSKEREIVEHLLKELNIQTEKLNVEQLLRRLEESDKFLAMDKVSRQIALLELKKQKLNEIKRRSHLEDSFMRLLNKHVLVSLPWERMRDKLSSFTSFQRLSESERVSCYQRHLQGLDTQIVSDDDEDGALPDDEYDVEDKLNIQSALLQHRDDLPVREKTLSRSRSRK